jgi:predicted MFS family arabinose efflux permease
MREAHRTLISLCLAYIISHFHRTSLAVIGTDIQGEFKISILQLGFLSSLFFFAFTFAQIPAGIGLDKWGARKTMVGLLLLNALGAALFALAPNYEMLIVSRIILGIGNSALLIGALYIVAKEFQGAEFARYSGILLAVGTLGNLLSTMPLAFVQEWFGWRFAFWFFGAMALLFAYVLNKQIKIYPAETKRQGSFKEVFQAPDFWKLFLVQLAWYGGTMSLFGLWGRPFLRDYHGLDGIQSGNMLMLLPIASIFAFITMGKLDQIFNTRKYLVLAGIVINSSIFLTFGLFPTMPLWLVAALIALLGSSVGFFPFMLAHGRAIFPASVLGLGISTLNFANIGGVGVMQLFTSQIYEWLLAKGFTPLAIYPKLFLMMSLCLGSAGVFYAFSKDKKPL